MSQERELAASVLTDLLFGEPGIGRCLVAPDGRVLRANAEWLRYAGFSLDEVLGADIVELFPGTRDLAVELHARVRAGHRIEVPPHAERVGGDERWWEGSIAPVSMETGTGLLITAREVTPRAPARVGMPADCEHAQTASMLERQLEAAERLHEVSTKLIQADDIGELYEGILDTALAIMRADFASIQMLDPARGELLLLGFRGFNPRAAQFWQWVRPASRSTCGVALRDGVRVVVPDVDDCEWMAGSDDHETYRQTGIRAVQTTPLLSRSGNVIGMISTHWREVHAPARSELHLLDVLARQAADLVDRKRAEDTLREVDRRKTEFLAVLSHELRNPLAPIRSSVHLLDRAAPGTEQAARATAIIRRQTEHLTRLVDDLLDVTRVSRGKIALQRERVDLRGIVLATADDLRSVFAEARIELRVDDSPEPLWIDGDATRMAQVLGNLLQNAVKFTPAGGTVVVTTIASGDGAELRVRDTGMGFEPGTERRMFEAFAQGDQPLARSSGGLGLGLALVKGLVELHGGTVEARSGGVGRGAEIRVRLPLVAAPIAAAHAPRGAPGDAAPRVVLIVEDNPDAARTMADILELYGHRVGVARDGRSGIQVARELHPDVILCDIGLPDLDGYAFARALRTDAGLRSTRLVALSGYAQVEDRERARQAGFDAHVAKPASVAEVMAAVAGDEDEPDEPRRTGASSTSQMPAGG